MMETMTRPRKVSDEAILRALSPTAPNGDLRVMATSQVVDSLDISTNQARRRLADLAIDGYVDRQVLPGDIVWWLTDAGRAYLDDLED